jgi:hypothetical protein
MTQHASLPRIGLLASWALFLFGICLAPPAAADLATVATPVIQATGAVEIGETGNFAIPPTGITVEVTCGTAGATIRYTLDGTDPTSTSTLYSGAVAIAEQQNLTAQKTVTFKAKAFKDGSNDSATATAEYTNYAIPEFSMKIAVSGNQWGPSELEFGMKTGATDGADELYDTSSGSTPPASPPGVPPPPTPAATFTTDPDLPTGGGQFLAVDNRSRTLTKEFRVQVQLMNNQLADPAVITLSWGVNAGFPLPSVPSLKLVRETSAGVFVQVADLTQSGSLAISMAAFPTPGVEDDDYYRVFYIQCDFRGSLQVNLGPTGLPDTARWKYRELGNVYSDWHVSGDTTVAMHPGNYEVECNTVAGFYRPPNQIVTVASDTDPTVLQVDYLTAQSEATMTVSPTYDPETKTVDVECSFTYTPEVDLTEIVWTFNLPEGWSIKSITGLPEGWTYEINGNVVTFTAPAGRAAASGNYFGFDMELEYDGEEPGPLVVSVQSIQGTGTGDPVNTDPPEDVTSNPRTANLDVNENGSANFADLRLIYQQKILGIDQAEPAKTNINELWLVLDVNENGSTNFADLRFIYQQIILGIDQAEPTKTNILNLMP